MLYKDGLFVSAGRYASDKGWIHPARKNNMNELIFLTAGEMSICEDYCEYRLTKDDVLLLDAGRRSYGSRLSDEPVVFWRICFNGAPEEFRPASKTARDIKLFRPADPLHFESLCLMLARYSAMPEYPHATCDMLTSLILTELFVYGSAGSTPDLLAHICAYVREKQGNVRVHEAAEHFGYSEDYIARTFKKFYLKGLKAYIDTVRTNHIRQSLLDTSRNMKEIAEDEGFADYDSFYRFFKYNTGMTPYEYCELFAYVKSDDQ